MTKRKQDETYTAPPKRVEKALSAQEWRKEQQHEAFLENLWGRRTTPRGRG